MLLYWSSTVEQNEPGVCVIDDVSGKTDNCGTVRDQTGNGNVIFYRRLCKC